MRPQFQIQITGTFILGLAWTSLVSSILFGLAGCGDGGASVAGNASAGIELEQPSRMHSWTSKD